MEVRAPAPRFRRSKEVTVPAPQRAAAAARTLPEYATVAALRELYRTRAASPVEVVQDLFARIKKFESSLHCFVTPTPEIALARAQVAELQLGQSGAGAL